MHRLVRSPFALPALLLVVGLAFAYNEWSYHRSMRVVGEAVAVTDARAAVNRALISLGDTVRLHRRCLRGVDGAVCSEVAPSVQRLRADMAVLDGIARQWDAERSQTFALLRVAVEDRVREIDGTLALVAAGNRDAAMQWVDDPQRSVPMTTLETPLGRQLVDLIDADAADLQVALRSAITRYRFGIASLVLLAALGVVLYRRLLVQAFRQREARHREAHHTEVQRGLDRVNELVAERTRSLEELTSHLQAAREDERRSLARELHDEMGALLTAAKIDCARLRPKVAADNELKRRLEHLGAMLDEGIQLKRRIIEDLRPSALDGLGLLPALQSLCVSARERMGLSFNVSLDPTIRVDSDAGLAAYRFVQEALTNIAKYADAKRVTVRATVEAGRAWFEVEDDGRGFVVADVGAGHHGLSGMRFRMTSLGGTMQIDSHPGQGTRLVASLPLLPAPTTDAANRDASTHTPPSEAPVTIES